MRSFYSGLGMPLIRNNIDTDQIMPARFCLRPTRTGHAESLFGDWRKDPEFVLNNPSYRKASILVTGKEFATGSSREYAVWGLKDYGFKVIIAPSFGDIFFRNAIINDLLPIKISETNVEKLWALLIDKPDIELRINLVSNALTIGSIKIEFSLDPVAKRRYVENQDDIEMTFKYLNLIERYELSQDPHLSSLEVKADA